MRIFTENNSYDEKINFVDDDNNFVGFDMGADCCEYFGWFISEIADDKIHEDDSHKLEFEGEYKFDLNFFLDKTNNDDEVEGHVVFRLVAEGRDDKYLHLYNHHNGYYSHGWESSFKDKGNL